MSAYLFRLDDITDTINPETFDRCLNLLFNAGVKPILGVIPDNRDDTLRRFPVQTGFWERLTFLKAQGRISIALHGLHHVYHEDRGSLLYAYGIGPLSEFSGRSFAEQQRMIAAGIEILKQRGLAPDAWMAPNHSYDTVTLEALKANQLTVITDGVGLFPFRRRGLLFMPVLSGRPRRVPCGVTTICLHTETLTENDFQSLESFFRRNPRCLSLGESLDMKSAFLIAPCCNGLVRVVYWTAKKIVALLRTRKRS